MVTLSIVSGDSSIDVKRSLLDVPPTHYTLEISSFSDLLKMVKNCSARSYDSKIFEVSGYKWKLSIYPDGDEERSGIGYISMYLAIAETDAVANGGEIYVNFKIFMYDYLEDKFLQIQDDRERIWCFDSKKKECGFPQLISKAVFHDKNGRYLKRDKCIFGVEIIVCSFRMGEIVPQIKSCESSYTWTIHGFSSIPISASNGHYSEVFTLADYKWKLLMYHNEKNHGAGKYVSLYLSMQQSKPQECVYADFELSIIDQKNNRDKSFEAHHQFTTDAIDWGWSKFLSLEELQDESKGFLVDDGMRIQVLITGISDPNYIKSQA